MAQSDLNGIVQVAAVARQGCQETGGSGADVGAQRQREHPLQGDDSYADQRRQGRCENGTALDEESDSCSDADGEVTGEMLEWTGKVRVEGLLDDGCHATFQQGVEEFDHADQTDAQSDERADEKDGTNNSLGKTGISEQVMTWKI